MIDLMIEREKMKETIRKGASKNSKNMEEKEKQEARSAKK
jgi:hypothetical protein